ncbi:MAG: hypothetical protein ABSC53_03445 [Bacteroidota bacterium]|jgi:hypothetical protein
MKKPSEINDEMLDVYNFTKNYDINELRHFLHSDSYECITDTLFSYCCPEEKLSRDELLVSVIVANNIVLKIRNIIDQEDTIAREFIQQMKKES